MREPCQFIRDVLKDWDNGGNKGIVIKKSGLAEGKGVFIVRSRKEAMQALKKIGDMNEKTIHLESGFTQAG